MVNQQIQNLKLLAMDVDGVLTDGSLYYNGDGSESKRFHVHDGAWIRIWQRLGFKTAIITGRYCAAVARRMEDLEIDYVYQKALVKIDVFNQLLQEAQVNAEEVVYIGDSVMDLPVLRRSGWSATVPEAIDEVRYCCDYITTRSGGTGAVGELIRQIIRQKGLWDQAMERYRV